MKKNRFIQFSLLKNKRIALGLSQKALAEKIGVSQQHWDRYEKGYPIPLDKILSVSKVLNISKWDLLPTDFQPQEDSLDKDRLTSIIISIEKLIIEKKLHFSPEQKAKLILLLYEKFSKNPSNDNISQNIQEIITDLITKKIA